MGNGDSDGYGRRDGARGGLISHRSKDTHGGRTPTANAKSETIHRVLMFRDAYRLRLASFGGEFSTPDGAGQPKLVR